jgi:Ca-activated chloride channel family protein
MAAASNTLIYTLGIYEENDRDRNPKVLKQLARITGGEAFFPRGSAQLSESCKHIAADIRSQYTLGYVPSDEKKEGVYRSIRVVVHASEQSQLTVRTRSGYLVSRPLNEQKQENK